ncbi:hypothetical protein D0869_08643 [Hortaea werneckii]|uniref:Uncharacterized protein n=1 Tax=Hortaea werneckii TaxID=91943 RepID=A0A3M6WK85_HORWE|nr:hypothetical protein D0869_08643 [Hortaea werneckii]
MGKAVTHFTPRIQGQYLDSSGECLPTREMPRQRLFWSVIALTLLLVCTVVAEAEPKVTQRDVGALSTQEIEEDLQLAAHEASSSTSHSGFLQQAFAWLFPSSSPAVNAMIGTLYISGPPNLLLALCPTDIDPSSLNIMVAFAVGGLLGDTLFHLLPEIFLGEVPEGEVRAVFVEPNKNLLLGVAIMVGFVTFVAMDKGLRIATGGEGHTHEHGNHDHSNGAVAIKAATTGIDASGDDSTLRSRKPETYRPSSPTKPQERSQEDKPQIKLSAYLNIIADFTHNITDGLAMSSSFYASPTIGATTTLAVFCHEIPHEVGDFALLIQGGMSKNKAMGLQFVTALGAVLGTVIGIAVQEFGGSGAMEAVTGAGNQGLLGTSLSWGDMLLPFTAGTFLYVGTVGVIPEMLETGPNRWKELVGMVKQFAAMAVGAGIMLG